MELIVFDLDGTLLNAKGTLTPYTRSTLEALSQQGVAYTVATGRTLHAARNLLEGHGFGLPHVYKNGVLIWHPSTDDYSHQNFLTLDEVQHVLEATMAVEVTPFVFTLEPGNRHAIYHTALQNEVERRLAGEFGKRSEVDILPAARLPAEAEITNISALGSATAIGAIEQLIAHEPHLVAYAGDAWEGDGWRWIDIHHTDASKGGAVDSLREQLGIERVVCFGDGDNDLSLFATADESYAPENAAAHVRAAATEVIGHHDQEGIAKFLRKRFDLGP
jgi:Cof subfamily protein (haloacid dehalogenase superfamily)